MPDLEDQIEDSDWEAIDEEAAALRDIVAQWADSIRADIKGLKVELPDKCIGRSKEKWRPMKRIAVMAGGHWPETTDRLIERNLAEDTARTRSRIESTAARNDSADRPLPRLAQG
jgi:hypothetical protein